MTIVEYSATRIGSEWTIEDHVELIRVLKKIEATAAALRALPASIDNPPFDSVEVGA